MSVPQQTEESRPAADSELKPDSPDDLTGRSWRYVVRKTVREFGKDQCTDNAAALTYYAVLALFPGLIALLSLVGLVGWPWSPGSRRRCGPPRGTSARSGAR